MAGRFTSIFLCGFRATGKTTVGRILAERLGFSFMDLDELIERKAHKTITEITRGGRDWKEFRRLEHESLKELLELEQVVVGVGGGAPTNTLVCEETGETYGAMNTALLHGAANALIVLLTAHNDAIKERLGADEMKKPEVTRPILNEEKAHKVHALILERGESPDTQKKIIVGEIVDDSMQMFEQRKPLYAALTDVIVDTGKMGPEEAAEDILRLCQQ